MLTLSLSRVKFNCSLRCTLLYKEEEEKQEPVGTGSQRREAVAPA